MKHPGHRRVVDILRERESELFAIRANFGELENKFFQLENAFRINLAAQRRLENELELCKHGPAAEEPLRNLPDEVEEKSSKARVTLHSRLTKTRVERERWKDAFKHQKKLVEKQKLEHDRTISIIRAECEKILKNCRESGEKYFRELLKLYRDSAEKVKHLEEALGASEARASSTRHRIFEVANLLETLEKFRGVRSDVVCRRAAKALRSSTGQRGKSYEEDMRSLRQVTWDVGEKDENDESREFLKAQNSVLREVVKSLKKKLRDKFPEVLAGNSGENASEANNRDSRREDVVDAPSDNSKNPIATTEDEREESAKRAESSESSDRHPAANTEASDVPSNFPDEIATTERDDEDKQTAMRNRVDATKLESHRNGIPFVEYTIPGIDDRQFRARRWKTSSTSDDGRVIVEFVDSEEDFESATSSGIVLYLGDNVIKKFSLKYYSGVHCGVQTNGVRTLEKSVQTLMTTGTTGFSRLNAGVGILNSEKRAMERSLVNLERTVASLKADALGQARSMIVREARNLGDEFFSCLERLERREEEPARCPIREIIGSGK